MSTMRDTLQSYLSMRRALGFKLVSDGTGLISFIGFLEQVGAEYISTEHALAWALLPIAVQPARWARRLGFVRGFAHYCAAFDARTEIPPVDLLPHSQGCSMLDTFTRNGRVWNATVPINRAGNEKTRFRRG